MMMMKINKENYVIKTNETLRHYYFLDFSIGHNVPPARLLT